MIYAERGNKVVSITEEAIQRYVEQGFKIKNDAGAVIKATVPVDIPNLKKAYVEHTRKIEALEAENASLKQQIAELQSKPAKAVKAEAPAEEAEAVVEKPKRASKKTTEE